MYSSPLSHWTLPKKTPITSIVKFREVKRLQAAHFFRNKQQTSKVANFKNLDIIDKHHSNGFNRNSKHFMTILIVLNETYPNPEQGLIVPQSIQVKLSNLTVFLVCSNSNCQTKQKKSTKTKFSKKKKQNKSKCCIVPKPFGAHNSNISKSH